MHRGFEVWSEQLEDVSRRVDALLAWIEAIDPSSQFFGVLHTYQVHAPYIPPAELVSRFTDPTYAGPLRVRLEKYQNVPIDVAWAAAVGSDYWEGMLSFTEADVGFLSDLYDAEICYVDSQLSRLVRAIRSDPELGPDTAIIVLSDHGEEFKDHGKYQHDQVFEELLHVPLMVDLPAQAGFDNAGSRVSVPVQLVDIAPTVAELLSVDPGESGWSGRSLVPLLEADGERSWNIEPTYSELVVDPGPKYHRTVTFQGWKYIHIWQKNIDHTWEFLFHLDEDPAEHSNLVGTDTEEVKLVLARLRGLLEQHSLANQARAARLGSVEPSPLDADMEQLMRQLGYIK